MDTSLSKLWEIVKDSATVRGVTESDTNERQSNKKSG